MTVPSSRTREHDWRAYLATSRTDLAVYGYVALYLMLLYIGPRTPSWLSFTNGLYFVMGVITLVAQVIAARSTTLEIRDRRAWAWLAASSVVLLINGLTWTLELERGESTRLTDPLEVVVSLLSIVGLLYFPADRRVHLRDRRVQLDGALLLTAWLAMFWVFGLRTELNNSTAPLIERIGGLLSTWPEIGLAALVYLRAGNHPRRRAIALHFGALVTSAISVFIWNELRGFYLPGHWVDGAWFLAWVLRWRAARTAVLVTPVVGHGTAERTDAPLRRGIAPSAFVAGAYVSLIIAVLLGQRTGTVLIALAAVTLTALLLVRQRVELRETRALARDAAASAARFRSLIENASDFVLVVAPDYLVTFASPSAERAGLAHAGDTFLDAVHPEEREAVRVWLERIAREPSAMRCRVRTGTDTWCDGELRAHDRRTDPSVGGWVVNGRDVSEEAGLERRLRHSQKLGALNDMAGRIAHAFNNALSAIQGHAELMTTELPLGSQWRDDVGQIHGAATRGAAITRQLLGFSGSHAIQPMPIEVGQLTRELGPTLARLLPGDVVLSIREWHEPLVVLADRSQLEQVIVNLVTNARDAMPDGGPISVWWTSDDAAEVVLHVRDAGTGIAPDTLARIFDPFFTTKPLGRGTGLGLAMVDSMVRRAGGRVQVESAPGAGTTVHITLPRAAMPPVAAPSEARPEPATARHATILLVDDEVDVRRVSRRILERAGYTVLEADGGAAAIAIAQELTAPVDVLVTDMMMPGISGREVIEVFRQRWPQTPILVVTGYAAVGTDEQPFGGAVHQIVEKPFTAAVLTRAVASAMASGGQVPARRDSIA